MPRGSPADSPTPGVSLPGEAEDQLHHPGAPGDHHPSLQGEEGTQEGVPDGITTTSRACQAM